MHRLTRRTFLAAGAAAAALPSQALAQQAEFDVVVVGAGAAGIAAGRRLAAAGRRFVILEASDRVGGRCFTDTATFGAPYDRGAHVIHRPDLAAPAKLANAAGLEVYPARPGQKLRVDRRFAREGEYENFLAALGRANRAIDETATAPRDIPAAQALPKDLGEWRSSVEFMLGPFGCGKNLSDVSALDLARSVEHDDNNAFCRQGYGALIAKLAENLPVRLSTPVSRIATWRGISYVQTNRGTLQARAVIVTSSVGALAAGKIKFEPELPKRHVDALSRLSMGSYERIALDLPGNPLGLDADDLVVEKAVDDRTAALLANVGGSSLSFVDIGGKFGRGVAGQGEAAMKAFALEWLDQLFGPEVRRAVKTVHATQWLKDPWALGAFSAAAPGGQPGRQVLAEPHRERVWFAGEAVHETLWGTVGGAWESGERAAIATLKIPALPPRPGTRPTAERPAQPRPAATQPTTNTTIMNEPPTGQTPAARPARRPAAKPKPAPAAPAGPGGWRPFG